jgi:hypothetical protein
MAVQGGVGVGLGSCRLRVDGRGEGHSLTRGRAPGEEVKRPVGPRVRVSVHPCIRTSVESALPHSALTLDVLL